MIYWEMVVCMLRHLFHINICPTITITRTYTVKITLPKVILVEAQKKNIRGKLEISNYLVLKKHSQVQKDIIAESNLITSTTIAIR